MNLLFFSEYLKNLRTVGAVAPSSRYLARKMVAPIDFTRAKFIIEYGPGTGVFTAELLKRMQPGTKLLVIETNEAFYAKLQAKYANHPDVEIINASAEHADTLRLERELPAPDYIVSGLPFAALPAETSAKILSMTAQLLDGKGEFITFQYTRLKFKFFESYFKNIEVTREIRNVPPAYIMRCR